MKINQEKIIAGLLGLIVCAVIIRFGYGVLLTQSECLEQIAERYPNVSCGSAEYIYCEWNNETYRIEQYIEDNVMRCDLKKVKNYEK